MASTFASEKQRKLFAAVENCGELVFAAGPRGAVANLVGVFYVRTNERGDDQLDVGDGVHHVHLDWARLQRVEAGEFHGEGMLSFFDGSECLFKLYRMEGAWPADVIALTGNLIE